LPIFIKERGNHIKDRGENSFIRLPTFGAKIYNKIMRVGPIQTQISQIAQDLLNIIHSGILLDIGTGHGRLLKELHSLNPNINLYGLDISKSMIKIAKINLADIEVKLSEGSIYKAPYENKFFDLITSTGSFYLWNHPKESINEIYRILKPDCTAMLYETYKNYDPLKFKEALKQNLKSESLFRKKLLPRFLKKQLRMTYSIEEVEQIIKSTLFANSFEIDKITLASLPIWIRIRLKKREENYFK
jgi:ubiquinone/menaquinone biosynthesis C-methylase UbiE